jgi:hypothetical protein
MLSLFTYISYIKHKYSHFSISYAGFYLDNFALAYLKMALMLESNTK